MTKRQIIIGLMEMLFYRQNILRRREVDYIDNAITFLEHSSINTNDKKWIRTNIQLPRKGEWVLVKTNDWQKPVEIMCYMGVRIGHHDIGNGWEEYEFPAWTSGHGDIKSKHPEVWMPLPDPL